jgi:hypothetical protein
MREIAHNWISPVRIKVNASQIAVATAGAAQLEDRSAKQKTTFFDTIGHKQNSRLPQYPSVRQNYVGPGPRNMAANARARDSTRPIGRMSSMN